jgi:hypothetical protein
MLLTRPDGDRIPGLAPIRVLMPHVMPTRNGSAVYYEHVLDLTHTLPWLQVQAAQGRKVTLFHLVLASFVRVMATRPQMHRFVVGRRMYQRKHIEVAFAVKKAMRDDATMTAVKIRFQPTDDLDAIIRRVDEAIGTGRGTVPTQSEKEMHWTAWLPSPVLAAILWLQRLLDACNLLPAAMIDGDPLYASGFLANMGSIGLPAVWHHLYEYGTVPLFGAIGKVEKAALVLDDGTLAVRETMRIRWTFDERTTDGLYCTRSLDILKAGIENPETWSLQPAQVPVHEPVVLPVPIAASNAEAN